MTTALLKEMGEGALRPLIDNIEGKTGKVSHEEIFDLITGCELAAALFEGAWKNFRSATATSIEGRQFAVFVRQLLTLAEMVSFCHRGVTKIILASSLPAWTKEEKLAVVAAWLGMADQKLAQLTAIRDKLERPPSPPPAFLQGQGGAPDFAGYDTLDELTRRLVVRQSSIVG